ncbi:hypothetical protein Tco_1184920 [Tanacetum coccineum]
MEICDAMSRGGEDCTHTRLCARGFLLRGMMEGVGVSIWWQGVRAGDDSALSTLTHKATRALMPSLDYEIMQISLQISSLRFLRYTDKQQ